MNRDNQKFALENKMSQQDFNGKSDLPCDQAISCAQCGSPSRWISIKDRMPNPEGEWVLVYADGAQNCLGYTQQRGFHDWCGSKREGLNICIEDITHWMPLPDGPDL